jgi:hypothetical protein
LHPLFDLHFLTYTNIMGSQLPRNLAIAGAVAATGVYFFTKGRPYVHFASPG